jgi:hypothetical protein
MGRRIEWWPSSTITRPDVILSAVKAERGILRRPMPLILQTGLPEVRAAKSSDDQGFQAVSYKLLKAHENRQARVFSICGRLFVFIVGISNSLKT